MTPSALRLNARLSPELAQRIAYIRKRTGKSITEIVWAALERYFAEWEATERPNDALHASGFVGCASGPPNLSSDYKEQLTASLQRKVERRK